MRNIKLTLEYDGTDFSGWQSQAQGERTVQSVLTDAVQELTGDRPALAAAGRTDAGVHALGQVASFWTASVLPEETIMRALNAHLPPDVRVSKAEEVDGSFHPQYSARAKRYFYLISGTGYVSPFAWRYMWHFPLRLDASRMAAASEHLLGEHDFSAFMAAGSGAKGTVRKISRCMVVETEGIVFFGAKLEGRFVRVSIEGTGFLRHMVRNIVGTLVDVGRGARDADSVREVIMSKDRGTAGPTAPAKGLFLEKVIY